MDMILLVARLALAIVFVVAGVAKLLDLDGSRRAMHGFGLPSSLAAPAGLALPIAELVVAALLLPRATAWWGALGAAILLGAFIAGIAINLARGRAPDCHCFGQLHSEPIGTATLIRNGALLVLAMLIAGFGWNDPGTSAVGWIGDLSVGELVVTGMLTVVVLAIAAGWWLTLNLLTQNGRLVQRIERLEASVNGEPGPAPAEEEQTGLPVGSPAPAFTLDGLDGQPVSLDQLRDAGKPVLAIFTAPHCGPCLSLMPDIARAQQDADAKFTVTMIGHGTIDENRAKANEYGVERMLVDPRGTVSRQYDSDRTPAAVIILPDGTVGSPLIRGSRAVQRLLQPSRVTVPPTAGAQAPDVTLPNLAGESVSLSDYAGRDVMLVFWSPTCGFCQRMAPDLRDVLAGRDSDAPEVVLISSGTVEENRALGIDVPILLDEGFTTGRTFGARGTPSAVLIAGDGTLRSPVTVGAPAIMTLLGATANVPERVASA